MNIDEYKNAVKVLFASGTATDEQLNEMARCVLKESENEYDEDSPNAIDDAVIGKRRECRECGSVVRVADDECCGCGEFPTEQSTKPLANAIKEVAE